MKRLFAFFFLFFTVSAYAEKQLIFFGDSLTDNGNLYSHTYKRIPKSPPYFGGRFTNGLTWAEQLAINYSYKYQDYAVGGATAIFHLPTSKFVAPTTLSLEVYKYILDSLFQDRSENLYVIWVGDNDYMFYPDYDPDDSTNRVVEGITGAMTTLASYGAKNFLILNLMDSSRSPYVQAYENPNAVRNLVMVHNAKLTEALHYLQQQKPEIKITLVDTFTFFNELLDNPKKFNKRYHINITDSKNACWQGGLTLQALNQMPDDIQSNSPEINYTYLLAESGSTPCTDANEHVFWDEIHPTSIAHLLIARYVIEKLEATYAI